MICNKCNHEILTSCKFCPNCGNKIVDNESSTIKSTKVEVDNLNTKFTNNNNNKHKFLIGALLLFVLGSGVSLIVYNKSKTQNTNNKPIVFATIKVPSLKNNSLSDAKRKIENYKLSVGEITEEYNDTIPEGNIISYQPSEGFLVRENTTINLVVSRVKEKSSQASEHLITKEQAVEIMKKIMPEGNFEYETDESNGGVEYCVIRKFGKGAGTIPTEGWFYVDKKTGNAFEWNLANNTLVEINANDTDLLNKEAAYNELNIPSLGEALVGKQWINKDTNKTLTFAEKLNMPFETRDGKQSSVDIEFKIISDKSIISAVLESYKDGQIFNADKDNLGYYDYNLTDAMLDNSVLLRLFPTPDNMISMLYIFSYDRQSFEEYDLLPPDINTPAFVYKSKYNSYYLK